MTQPVLVSLALGNQSEEVLQTAAALALRLNAPLGVVHALSWRPFESSPHLAARAEAVRAQVVDALKSARDRGLALLEPVVEARSTAELVVETGSELAAQMIVTGGGGAETVRRWLLGSVAESIVRSASVPVFVVRGPSPPIGRPVLCPVDLSPHASEGLRSAARLARALQRPLVTLTVVPPDHGPGGRKGLDPAEAQDQVELLARSVDLGGVEVEHRVSVADDAAATIVEASQDAALLVIATRSFLDIAAGGMGAFTERVLRTSPCSTVVIRVHDIEDVSDEEAIRRLGRIKALAERNLEASDAQRALPLLELLVRQAPAHPRGHERLADALAALGRESEAASRRHVAALLREQLD